ncbi:MFS transporter [Parvibium lacunae]|uniref:MFS transporter n=2 Tax=Parvibium lacunae TaxID=1888893 RepID=A0A368L0G3_9BURK|nr:MFS transporter [Parvibium lacunae]RCS56559.1 MFS transporter [Parvibium lacunae]
MSAQEWRASLSLSSIFGLRMLGLFLILPVFAVHAHTLPGGDNASLVGLAIGIYGLTQACFQIIYGSASDRLGRKPVIIFGLILFAVGSFMAAAATDIYWTIAGRAIQGAGAISAAVTAFIADSTREEHRTKAMAMVGGMIGLTFATSLIAAPALYAWIGMGGLFTLTGVLSVLAIGVVAWVVPPAPPRAPLPAVPFREVLCHRELLRLNLGVFALHMAQMAMFVVVPVLLVEQAGMPLAQHWQIYLPVVLISFVFMVPPIMVGERRGKVREVLLAAIALLLLVELALGTLPYSKWMLVALLLAFFIAFNVLEALQPSLVSRIAPPAAKGAAMGIYNTTQAFGLFLGGAVGGWLSKHYGPHAIFWMNAAWVSVWLVVAWGMPAIARRSKPSQTLEEKLTEELAEQA